MVLFLLLLLKRCVKTFVWLVLYVLSLFPVETILNYKKTFSIPNYSQMLLWRYHRTLLCLPTPALALSWPQSLIIVTNVHCVSAMISAVVISLNVHTVLSFKITTLICFSVQEQYWFRKCMHLGNHCIKQRSTTIPPYLQWPITINVVAHDLKHIPESQV